MVRRTTGRRYSGARRRYARFSGRYMRPIRRRYFRGRGIKPELKANDVAQTVGSGTVASLKFHRQFCDLSNYTSSTIGPTKTNCLLLNGIANGTSQFQRIGAQVEGRSLLMRMCIKTPVAQEAAPAYNQCVRVMIIKDRAANQISPGVSTGASAFILASPGYASICPNNLEFRNRFKVLYDKRFVLIGGTDANTYYVEYYKKFKPRSMIATYAGTDATIGSISTNSLWLCCFSDDDPFTVPAADMAYCENVVTRFRYIDP